MKISGEILIQNLVYDKSLTDQFHDICGNEETRWSVIANTTLICSRRINFPEQSYNQKLPSALKEFEILSEYHK